MPGEPRRPVVDRGSAAAAASAARARGGDLMLGRGALAMWWDMAPQHREEFERWHTHEHFPERLALPGFLRASRWADVGGGEGFFVLYELDAYEALLSPQYLARLNAPSPWSRKMMPHHRHMVRSTCRVLATSGSTIASHVLTVRLSPARGSEDRLLEHLGARARELAVRTGLAGAHLLRTDVPALVATTEQRIRGHADRAADWIFIVSGDEHAALAALAANELSATALQGEGAEADAISGCYGLRLAMPAPDAP